MSVYAYTTIDDPLTTDIEGTQVAGINSAGQMVGTYFNAGWHGFLLSGGTYTTLDDPSTGSTFRATIRPT